MICLGTMNFGSTLDAETAFKIMDRFTEFGGKNLDTANCYASWAGSGDESELVIGAWLRSRGARDRVVVGTKVGGRPITPGQMMDWEGLGRAVVPSAVEDSLRRLGVDHVDVCFAHLLDDAVPQDETLAAFQELVVSGKVKAVGLSNQYTESLRRARESAAANGWVPVTYVQQRYSYLQPIPGASFGAQMPLTDHMSRYVQTQPGMVLQGYSPLLSGAYTRADRELWPHYAHPDTDNRLVALRKVADDLGVTPNQVVLAWMLGSTPAVQPVIGVSSLEQLDECLAATEVVLDAEHLRVLEQSE